MGEERKTGPPLLSVLMAATLIILCLIDIGLRGLA